jgi:heptosyltransferase-2
MPPCDVGLNFLVGSKWPSKAWPMKNWDKIEGFCVKHGLKVTRQQGEKDLEQYIDWINSCRLIVTCDSLGMHLALALKKKVVALFGPTPSEQIYMYGRGVILTADWACAKAPCMSASCPNGHHCMTGIQPRMVARVVNNLLNGQQ